MVFHRTLWISFFAGIREEAEYRHIAGVGLQTQAVARQGVCRDQAVDFEDKPGIGRTGC